MKRLRLETEHLFYNAVPCAAMVFGLDDDIGYIDLDEGSLQITGKGDNYLYLRFTPKTEAQLHTFSIKSDSSFNIAYDFLNCDGRTNITTTPNKVDGYCEFIFQRNHFDFRDYESTGPIYIGIKLVGNATVEVAKAQEVIRLIGKEGSIQMLFTESYQSYTSEVDDIGYIIVNTTTEMATNDIKLYYNNKTCGLDDTMYPRPLHFCTKSEGSGNTSLIIPNQDKQINYYGVQIGQLDTVEFSYSFIKMIEVEENKEYDYKFNNAFTTPFQVQLKKGVSLIMVDSGQYDNICDIYVDYEGCGIDFTKLPNKRDYCLSSTFNKKHATCTVKFELDHDAVVYFGIENSIGREMTFAVYTIQNLLFLE
jgi:hypothetical protein